MFGKKKKQAEEQARLEAEQQAREAAANPEDDGLAFDSETPVDGGADLFNDDFMFGDGEVEAEILTDDEAAQLEELQAVLLGGFEDEPAEESEESKAEEAPAEEPVEEAPAVDEAHEEEAPAEEEVPEEDAPAEESSEEEPTEEAAEEPAEEVAEEEPEDASEEPAEEESAEEEPVEDEAAEEEATSEETEELEEEVEEEVEESEEAEEESEEEGEDDESVVYVVDGPEEDDEVVHPARLVKLPHLIDYMIAQGMSKSMKMKVALMLIQTYKKFKDSPEDNKICLQCMAKVMQELMKK